MATAEPVRETPEEQDEGLICDTFGGGNLTDGILSELSRMIYNVSMRQIAREFLSLSDAEVENIDINNNRRCEEANYDMLKRWRDVSGSFCGGVQKLHQIFVEAMKNDINISPEVLGYLQSIPSKHEHQDRTTKEIKRAYKEKFKDINLDPSDSSIKVPAKSFWLELELTEIDDMKCTCTGIQSYQHLFEKGKGPYRIALYAPAGCGKTCMCQMMSFCWAEDNILGDKFDLVLFMRLRGHSLQDDVAGIIVHGAFPHKPEENVSIGELIKRHKGRILFVLDGYDELVEGDKPEEQGVYTLQKLLDDTAQHIIISTRPTQLDELKKSVAINMKVKIKGLSEDQAKLFIVNYCKLRNIISQTDQPIEDVIMDQMRKNNLLSLSKNPQQLQLVCDYHRDKRNISGCLTYLYDNFYTRNCNEFLRKVREDDKLSKQVKDEMLSEKYETLLRNVENLALTGFVQGRLIYDERSYLMMLGKFFVMVFDKIGFMYFENAEGGQAKVLGFRHKSFQEYFGAKCMYRYLMKHAGECPKEVREALLQWRNLKWAIKYERMFVFMAGMAENENEAKVVLDHITAMLKQLPKYFASRDNSNNNLHDLEDLPRQVILLQTRCVLEIKAAKKCDDSPYIQQLLEALPYSEGSPPPDVNAEQDEEEDMWYVGMDKKPSQKRKPQLPSQYPVVSNANEKQASVTKYVLRELAPEKERNQQFIKMFWFRIMLLAQKTDIRVDCVALPGSILRAEGEREVGPKSSFFTSNLTSEMESLLDNHNAVQITLADFELSDVISVNSMIKKFSDNNIILHANTCHRFTIKINVLQQWEYVDCHMENETTIKAVKMLQECHYRPIGSTLCLQRWTDISQESKRQFLAYCKDLRCVSGVRLEQCKLVLRIQEKQMMDPYVFIFETNDYKDLAWSTSDGVHEEIHSFRPTKNDSKKAPKIHVAAVSYHVELLDNLRHILRLRHPNLLKIQEHIEKKWSLMLEVIGQLMECITARDVSDFHRVAKYCLEEGQVPSEESAGAMHWFYIMLLNFSQNSSVMDEMYCREGLLGTVCKQLSALQSVHRDKDLLRRIVQCGLSLVDNCACSEVMQSDVRHWAGAMLLLYANAETNAVHTVIDAVITLGRLEAWDELRGCHWPESVLEAATDLVQRLRYDPKRAGYWVAHSNYSTGDNMLSVDTVMICLTALSQAEEHTCQVIQHLEKCAPKLYTILQEGHEVDKSYTQKLLDHLKSHICFKCAHIYISLFALNILHV